MKETLYDIVEIISSYEKERQGTNAVAIARVHCLYDGEEKNYWFTENGINPYFLNELRKYGMFVRRNSNIAIKLQKIEVGASFDYIGIDKLHRPVVFHVDLENRTNFQDKIIRLAGDSIKYQYRNIEEFLASLRENKDEILDAESKIQDLMSQLESLKKIKNTGREREKIKKSIGKWQETYRILTLQQEDLKNITIYIRKQGEMRYAMIVDTIQTKIKSQNIFDGKTVIIEGGPGTGKSTTMIHRLGYLTDEYAIREDMENGYGNFNLTQNQCGILLAAIRANRDWIFFSPSRLLKEYLSAAMAKEGLNGVSGKVWNWQDYCRLVLQKHYHLLEHGEEKAPFKECYCSETLFWQDFGIVNEFETYYLEQLRQIKHKLPRLNGEGVTKWDVMANNIIRHLDGIEGFGITDFIRLFNTLENVYGKECNDQLMKNRQEIESLATKILEKLNSEVDVKDEIYGLLADKEYEGNEDDNAVSSSGGDIIVNMVEKWVKQYSRSKVDKEYSMTELNLMLSDILLPILKDDYAENFQKIGKLIEYERYAQLTKGIRSNMLSGLPQLYKRFRIYLQKTKYGGCDLNLLRKLIKEKNGKCLHFQEQSLLLGFINTLAKAIMRVRNVKHDYIEAYKELSRPIIGVDEATDFSVCELYAIQSFLSIDINSLTLCGDMMQRMTDYGIKSWSELDKIVPMPIKETMRTSYRQSRRLLELARQIYMDVEKQDPGYKAFMKSNKVPEPLIFVHKDEMEKIKWISKRIEEVYNAYGEQLPSIAIFVNDKGYIPKFVLRLQKSDFFKKNSIRVCHGTDCGSMPSGRYICVYPINEVKGMEFDVAFFHNIDNCQAHEELLKRYIYVGVSRAAFFLAVTMEEQNEQISKYFKSDTDWRII